MHTEQQHNEKKKEIMEKAKKRKRRLKTNRKFITDGKRKYEIK